MTRAQILVRGTDVTLYRHNNGSPDGRYGVMAVLRAVIPLYSRTRGHDWATECFLPAVLLHRMIEDNRRCAAKLRRLSRQNGDDPVRDYTDVGLAGVGVEPHDELGFGPKSHLHADIDYFYRVSGLRVDVYRPANGFTQKPCLDRMSHIRGVILSTKPRGPRSPRSQTRPKKRAAPAAARALDL